MHIVLFDDHTRYRLLPFTHTRPVADIRCGILTMRERWAFFLHQETTTLTADYLQDVFPLETGNDNLYLNASVFATKELTESVLSLGMEQALVQDGLILAVRTVSVSPGFEESAAFLAAFSTQDYQGGMERLENITDIFSKNDAALRTDFNLITAGRNSQPVPDHITVSGKENLFIEEGATIHPCIINAAQGPVYIGRDAEVMEGCLLRGPLAIGEHAILKMGARIYGATTIGPGCRAGGEIGNVVMFANSNKGHDGYLGNAVLGEWCNLGADTNSSNLKNNYEQVKIWDEHRMKSADTELQFCGLLMGDHSKCGINTMFNTGTVAGVSCNIYGSGFPEKFIPSFSWGGSEGMTTYDFNRAMDTAGRVMARRGLTLSDASRKMYRYIFDHTAEQRRFINGK